MTKPNDLPQLAPPRIRNILKVLSQANWGSRDAVPVVASPVLKSSVKLDAAARLAYRPVRPGETFGPRRGSGESPWQQRWFRVSVPARRRGEAAVGRLLALHRGALPGHARGMRARAEAPLRPGLHRGCRALGDAPAVPAAGPAASGRSPSGFAPLSAARSWACGPPIICSATC